MSKLLVVMNHNGPIAIRVVIAVPVDDDGFVSVDIGAAPFDDGLIAIPITMDRYAGGTNSDLVTVTTSNGQITGGVTPNPAGQVNINYPAWDTFAPFGGYKQSGNGREYADWAIHDFLEVKGIIGNGVE